MQNSKLRKIFDTNIPVYILSFLIPVLVLLIGMWIKDVYPMGDRSVLLWDLEIQYTDLFVVQKCSSQRRRNLIFVFEIAGREYVRTVFSLSYQSAEPADLFL